MRILILHSRYLSGETSGENRVVDDERVLLERAGHEVRCWDPEPEAETLADRLRLATSAVWSRTAVSRLRRLLRETSAEIVHCHNLFPKLSPAVIRTAADCGVPAVVTLHNFRFLCLPATLLRNGRVCEDCVGRLPWPGVIHRCYRGSALGSSTLALSLTTHRAVGTFGRASLYFAVSGFLRDKFVAAGWPAAQIAVKSNFVWPITRRQGSGDYFLYLGRLSSEKGLGPLLRAWHGTPAKLLVVGSGPLEQELRALAPGNVEFHSSVPASAVGDLLARARALVLPSRCYEGQPRSILEAYAAGVPVLTSNIGGLPEVVVPGSTGLLLPVDDDRAWIDGATQLLDDSEAERLGHGAFDVWRRRYSPEPALEALEALYKRVTCD